MHTHIYMCISVYIYIERESVYSCLAFTNPYTYKPEGFHRFLHQVHLHLGLFFWRGGDSRSTQNVRSVDVPRFITYRCLQYFCMLYIHIYISLCLYSYIYNICMYSLVSSKLVHLPNRFSHTNPVKISPKRQCPVLKLR